MFTHDLSGEWGALAMGKWWYYIIDGGDGWVNEFTHSNLCNYSCRQTQTGTELKLCWTYMFVSEWTLEAVVSSVLIHRRVGYTLAAAAWMLQ